MIDIVDKATRSRMMSGIRSHNTKPEVRARSALHKLGYRFRLASKVGNVRPDIVLRSRKVAIFVHGCYWHQHKGCNLAYSDRTYSEYWKTKFKDNKARDKRVQQQLIDIGWRVVIIWECSTRNDEILSKLIQKLGCWIEDEHFQYFESEYRKT